MDCGWAARVAVRREVVTPGRHLYGKFLGRKARSVGDETWKAELSSVQRGGAPPRTPGGPGGWYPS